jgi:hypothetical protein
MNYTLKLYLAFLLLLLSGCKYFDSNKEENLAFPSDLKIPALVIVNVGNSFINGKKINSSETIDLTSKINVNENSFLDLQVLVGELKSVIRIKGKATVQLKAVTIGGITSYTAFLDVGSFLFNIKKMQSRNGFQVVTPVLSVGVRGTQFQITVAGNGDSTLQVAQGEVSAKIRVPSFDLLLERKILTEKDVVKQILFPLQEESILKLGEKISITQKDVNKVLDNAQISEFVKNLELNKDTANSEQNYRAIVDNFQINLSQRNLKIETVSGEISQQLKVLLKQAANDKKAILESEFNELNGIDEKLIREGNIVGIQKAIKDHLAEHNAKYLERIEIILGKSAETLVTKDGRNIRGVILQRGEDYIVVTPDGEVFIQGKDFKGIEF